MKKLNSIFGILLLVIGSSVHAQNMIEVFTDEPVDFSQLSSITHYDLSEPDRVRRTMSLKLPPNEEEATRIAQAWFNSPAGLAYQKAMMKAYKGKQKLIAYQLLKTPAIVFDAGKYVVYGTTDLSQAIYIYQQKVKE